MRKRIAVPILVAACVVAPASRLLGSDVSALSPYELSAAPLGVGSFGLALNLGAGPLYAPAARLPYGGGLPRAGLRAAFGLAPGVDGSAGLFLGETARVATGVRIALASGSVGEPGEQQVSLRGDLHAYEAPAFAAGPDARGHGVTLAVVGETSAGSFPALRDTPERQTLAPLRLAAAGGLGYRARTVRHSTPASVVPAADGFWWQDHKGKWHWQPGAPPPGPYVEVWYESEARIDPVAALEAEWRLDPAVSLFLSGSLGMPSGESPYSVGGVRVRPGRGVGFEAYAGVDGSGPLAGAGAQFLIGR